MLRGANPGLGFLLECVQHPDRILKLDGVHRTVSVAVVSHLDREYFGAVKALQWLGVLDGLACRRRYKRKEDGCLDFPREPLNHLLGAPVDNMYWPVTVRRIIAKKV